MVLVEVKREHTGQIWRELSIGHRVGHLPHGGTGSKTQDKAEKGELLGDEAFEKGTEGPAGLQDGMEGVVVAV